MTEKFDIYVKKYQGLDVAPDIEVMIGGFLNGKCIIKRFYIIDGNDGTDECIGEEGTISYLIFGSNEQKNILEKEIESKKNISINKLQDVFQEVLNMSAPTNSGINNKMKAVFIENKQQNGQQENIDETSVIKNGIYRGEIKITSQITGRSTGSIFEEVYA